MPEGNQRKYVHIVSHGPHCLDGVAAAVAVARARPGATVVPVFVNNPKIDEAILSLRCEPPDAEHEVWITDISWTDPRADEYLRRLAERGVKIYWIDHHRTAIERFERGEIRVPFAGSVVRDDAAASRLVYEFLAAELGEKAPEAFRNFRPVVEMADDNDRWIHRIPGSRELALTVRALGGIEAYEELLAMGPEVRYSPRMERARERLAEELRRTFEIAERTRVDRPLEGGLTLVAAVCDGYASEIADAWGKSATNAVFALFDARSLGVSLRRSPDCQVDLSRLASRLGGGGHPAAAGCEIPGLQKEIAVRLAEIVGEALRESGASSS
ncbi:MAG: hypothetical protein KatS3mg076_1440 [Candidatus Binatia bacterium]|nr:MAG: hypothetical protein KatS3mg076_1440 [Candidatus Binatia bacterium]